MDRKHSGKRINCSSPAISPFPTVFSKRLVLHTGKNQGLCGKGLKIVRRQTNYCLKLNEIEENNFRSGRNGGSLSKQ